MTHVDRKVGPKLSMTHVVMNLDASLLRVAIVQNVHARSTVAVALIHNVLYNTAGIRRALARVLPLKPLKPRVVVDRLRGEKRGADDRAMTGSDQREPSDGLPEGTLEKVVPEMAAALARHGRHVNFQVAAIRTANGPMKIPLRSVRVRMVPKRRDVSRPT